MSEAALDEAARLLARRVGLRLDPAVRGRLAGAVRDEARRRGESATEYVAHLGSDSGVLQDLLNRVTVQETSFFRDPRQFLAFASDVLPALSGAGMPVQVWSAGCANGQEAYSLAMVLAESGLKDWRVTATDISTKALDRTAAARYTDRELAGLSPARRERHLVPVAGHGDTWEVAPALRQGVRSLRHNLAADPPPIPPGHCQVVFCRNVLIYFGHDDVVDFLNRLSAWLPAGGHLFLGYSESLWLVSERFHLVRLGDAFVYRNGPAEHPVALQGPVPAGGRSVPTAQRPAPFAQRPAPFPQRPLPARMSPAGPADPRVATQASPPPPPLSPPPRPRDRPPNASDPVSPGLLAEGEAAMGAQDYAGAVTAFRKAVFLDPEQPLAYLSLGLALEALGDLAAARRAYTAARASVSRCDAAAIETTLEGYRLDELTHLLELKAGAP